MRNVPTNAPTTNRATPTDGDITQLVALFNARRYAELESRACVLAAQYPHSGLICKIFSAALQMQGKDYLPALQKAADLLPGDAEVHNNLAVAMRHQRRFDDAVTSLRRALQLQPGYTEAHLNLGLVLQDLGQLEDAVTSFRQALKINPESAKSHCNLGNALRDQGQRDDAVASYRRALDIKPDYAEAQCNLGAALQALGQRGEAIASYRRALDIKPDYAEAQCNLGTALQALGQLGEAVASYRRALDIKPDYAEAHNNLGTALQAFEQHAAAAAHFRRALDIKPDYIEAHNNVGNAWHALGQHDDAVAAFRRALQINPDYAEAQCNLGNALQALGQFDDAVASYRRALEIKPDYAVAHSNVLFIHNFQSCQRTATLLAEARCFGDLAAQRARPYTDWPNPPETGRCLRVGLVSGDLRNHPVGYFVEGMLAALASAACGRLEFIAYSNHFFADAVTARIQSCCHGWHSAVGLSDENLARRIRDDGIDILIDLSGHTAHNRLPLFAWRAAPVQASWLGYFATTGVAAIDYLIADPWTAPATEEIHFTEKIWRLPESRLCFTPPDVDVHVSPLPALEKGAVTFGCFNNLSKMNDAVVALWAAVLHAVPKSRLFLKAKQLNDANVHQRVLERFALHGIGNAHLILEGAAPRPVYLATYRQVDIALDPFPYTGGTTTVEALWMGVPVLTVAGERFLSRQGVGLLTNAGLLDWVATDADDFVARAVSHAGDLQRLATLRSGLRQQVLASPLFDAPRFARHFDTALRAMWTQWCSHRNGQSNGE